MSAGEGSKTEKYLPFSAMSQGLENRKQWSKLCSIESIFFSFLNWGGIETFYDLEKDSNCRSD